MSQPDGASTFQVSGEIYDAFMGRYSGPLAVQLADACGVSRGQRALDVGCGPGALTAELVRRLGASSVAACDPSVPFVAACRDRNPGADVREGRAEALPFADHSVDLAVASLVLHFMSDPARGIDEMRRVVVPGGQVAACVWDFDRGMQLFHAFWEAAVAVDPQAPAELYARRFGRPGEVVQLLEDRGLEQVSEQTMTVQTTYASFEEVLAGLMAGIGPAGSYLVAQPEGRRQALRSELFSRLGSPAGSFTLQAVARSASGVTPAP
ncbi:class I SAM-dependent methyltransferase [Rhodococcus sp. X156]|uniref:class I SAM-dependent methyltransferase n=1 Tax=Rhodococcus sp. X156 TaxID=2499145 RepID=UPI000FD6DC72|nr:class I SAM-dependent methyltransferase [Rhodococcus sp. X156]